MDLRQVIILEKKAIFSRAVMEETEVRNYSFCSHNLFTLLEIEAIEDARTLRITHYCTMDFSRQIRCNRLGLPEARPDIGIT